MARGGTRQPSLTDLTDAQWALIEPLLPGPAGMGGAARWIGGKW